MMALRWPRWLDETQRRRLRLAALVAVVLPWLGGVLLKALSTTDDPRALTLIDYQVAGGIVFGASMWLAYAVGLWVVATMKGPRRDGDPFPSDDNDDDDRT